MTCPGCGAKADFKVTRFDPITEMARCDACYVGEADLVVAQPYKVWS